MERGGRMRGRDEKGREREREKNGRGEKGRKGK